MDRSHSTQHGAWGLRHLLGALAVLALGATSAVHAEVVPTINFTGPASYTPGSAVDSSYTLTLGNTGSTTATVGQVTTNFPAGATIGWSCTASTGSGTSCPSGGAATGTGNMSNKDPGTLAQNGTLTYVFLVTFASSTASAPLVVTATFADGETSPDNDSVNDSVSSTRDPDTDLDVTFIASPPSSYVPGNTISSLTVRVRNNGPTDSPAALVQVTLPTGTSGATWTCASCTPATGSGNVSATVPLAANATRNIVISTIAVASSVLTDPLPFVANVEELASETSPANNSATLNLARDPKTDYEIAFEPTTATTYTPGTTGALPGPAGNTLAFKVTNNGPTDSSPARVQLAFPAEVSAVSWSCRTPALCSTPSGTGAVDTNVTLDNDAFVYVDLVLSYPSSALAPSLSLVASVAAAAGEDDAPTTNNSATKVLNIARRANLSVLKTGPAAINPGSGFVYEITVSNLGPSDIGNGSGELGALLDDTFVAQLQGNPLECGAASTVPCWEYCPGSTTTVGNFLPDASCPGELSTGSGSIVDRPFKLRAGSSSKLLVHAAVGGLATGSISNSASVSSGEAAVVDGVPANNSSGPVVTDIDINTDINIVKTDSVTTAVPGVDHSYQITVTNQGFVTANNVAVNDTLPLYTAPGTAGFNPGSVRWQCSAFAGACCNTNSANCGVGTPTAAVTADVLAGHIDLPGQSHVVFTVTGRLNPRASGTLSNTATATLSGGIVETDTGDNSSTDNNTLLVPTGSPTISKSLTSLVTMAGTGNDVFYRLTYRIRVANGGPSFINDAALEDTLSSTLLDAATANWGCTVTTNPTGATRCLPATGIGALDTVVRLDPGGALEVDLVVDTIPNASGEVINTAELTSPAGNATTTLTSGLSGSANLTIAKTDTLSEAVPGDDTEYRITVTNNGPDDVFGAVVSDLFDPELENVSWTCAATTPVPGDLSESDQYGAANTAGDALVASADGRHIYVIGTAGDSVVAFVRDAVPGVSFGSVAVLETELNTINDVSDSGPAVTGMDAPIDVALSPDGAALYVLSQTAIVAFNRVTNTADPNFGKLSFAGSVTAGMPTTPRQLVLNNQNLYVSGDALISIYRRDQVSGLPVHEVQHTVSVPALPGAMAISIPDALLFVASSTGQVISSFAINTVAGSTPIGRLSLAASLTHANLAGTTDLVAAPAEKQLYAAAGTAGFLNLLTYGPGTLTRTTSYTAASLSIPGSPPNPFAGSVHLALAPDGEHLLSVQRSSGMLLSLRRDVSSGGLEYDDLLRSGIPAGSHLGLALAADVAVSSDGRHVFVASASTNTPPLTVYARRAPDPLFAFIEQDRQGDPLAGGGTLAGLTAVADVVGSVDGDHVYAIGLQDNALVAFTRNSTSGFTVDTAGEHLEHLQTLVNGASGISGLDRPSAMHISHDGRSVYVSSEEGDSVAVFDREANGALANYGKLTFRQVLRDGVGGVDGLLGARGMAMDRDGRHLYVAGSFESTIQIFSRAADRTLSPLAVVRSGTDGVTGLGGIRDLVVTRDGLQVLGVSATANAVVAFNRDNAPASANFGRLSFVQAKVLNIGDQLVSLALPALADAAANAHVYVVAETSNRLYVLRRNLDPGSPASGTLQNLAQYNNGTSGITRLMGPSDVEVSADGERVYVGAQFGHSVLVFDRDTNRSSAAFGALTLVETRSDGVDGVDGLNNVYGITVSPDSRNVYAAGFGDNAIASFAVGTGSTCSAGGSGDIVDSVDIGVGGTLQYRVTAHIRPDAFDTLPPANAGELRNRATVTLPPRFSDSVPGDNESTDGTALTPRANISVSKTNDRVSVVAGETVRYEIQVRNDGLSNIDNANSPFTLTDTLNPSFFNVASAQWSCIAAGSGALDFVDGYFEGQAGIAALDGVSGLALVADQDGAGPLDAYLASVSVTDNALNIFARDPGDGRLMIERSIVQGSTLGAATVSDLAGARAVAASRDGRFVYVASRISDAISVFQLSNNGGTLGVALIQTVRNVVGLDQAVHLLLSAEQPGLPELPEQNLYVAGANDDAVAVFTRDTGTGMLTWLESEQNGVNDAGDAGGTVAGLDGVEFLMSSRDGQHVYAVSGASGSIATFSRNAAGRLSWRNVRDGNDFGQSMAGASSAVIDGTGSYVYVTAADANRVLVLSRETNSGSGNFGNLTFASSVTQDVDGGQGLLTPSRAVVSADNNHLYVTSRSAGSIAWFSRDPTDGSLQYLGLRSNESAGVDGMAGATDLVIDDALNQVYIAGTQQAAIAQFERQVDSFCPASGSGNLSSVPLRIAAGGSVTFVLDVQVISGYSGPLVNTVSINTSQDTDPADNTAQDADVVSVVADLSITKSDGLAEFDGLAGSVAVVGDDEQIYVAGSSDDAIGIYDRDILAGPNFGALSFNSFQRSGENGVLGLADVNDLLLSADGDHVYATSPTDSSVATFARNRSTGKLAFVEIEQNGVFGVSGLSGAQALAQSPDGAHVYVAGGFANAVATFTRDADSGSANYGRLTYKNFVQNGVAGVDGIAEPVAVAVAPNGLHVYVLGAANDSIALFARNPNPGSSGFGQLTFVARYLNDAGGFTGLAGVKSLLINAAGTRVYVLANDTGNLVRLNRDITTGVLTPAQVLADGLLGATRMRFGVGENEIYVAGHDADAIGRYTISVADGALTFAGRINNGDPAPLTGGQVLGLDGVRDVLVSPDGAHLYSVADIDNAAAVFARDPGDASLSFQQAMFDGLGGVAPGDNVSYVIVAANDGPSNVLGAIVTDNFPDAFNGVSWTCTSTGGASCLSSGNGSINTAVNLPVGGRVTFVATGAVGEAASGRLSNTATISSSGNLDPDTTNNSATDADTVLSPAMDLIVAVNNPPSESVPGTNEEYEVLVENSGPTYASGAIVRDTIPPALYNVAWTCVALPVAGTLAEPLGMADANTQHAAIAVGSLGNFVYTAGSRAGVGAVIAHQRNPLDGTLTEIAVYRDGFGGVTGLSGAADLILSSDERFLYVASAGSDAVALFSRNTGTGLLSFVRQYQDGVSGVDGLGGARALLMHPGGAHLYVAGSVDDAIAVFQVNAATGALTFSSVLRQTDAGVDGLNGVNDLAWGNGGTHLLATATSNQSLSAFTRNAGTGALSFATSAQDFQFPGNTGVLNQPGGLAVHEDQVFLAASGGNRVSRFRFAVLPAPSLVLDTVITNGQGGVTGMTQPRAVIYDPDQARLYVVSNAPGALHLFSLLGAQPELLESRFAASNTLLTGGVALALSHNGKQLYTTATQPGGGIAVWARERGSRCAIGGVRELGAQTVDIAPGGSVSFSIGGDIFANATGTLVYQARVDTRVASEELNPANNSATDSNTLEPSSSLTIAKSDGIASVVAGTPLRYDIDVNNGGVSDALLADLVDATPLFPAVNAGFRAGDGAWTCSANAPLAFTRSLTSGTVPALAGVTGMALSLDGSQLFAINGLSNALLVFPRAPDGTLANPSVIIDGTVLADTTVAGMAGVSNVTLTADGRHLLITSATANSLLVFGRDNGGNLRFVQKLTSGAGGISGLLGAADVVASLDGRRVFVASAQSHAIAVFTRDATTGLLSFVERVADGLGTIVPDSNVIRGVRRLHLTSDGLHLYSVATLSNALSRFAVHPATGKLTYAGAQRSSAPGLAALAGARDLVAAPGDTDLYALGSSGVVHFDRAIDGTLTGAGSTTAIPGLSGASAITLDQFGSRLYLSDTGGAVFVLARDWSNGALDYRSAFVVPASGLGAPGELLHVAATNDLYTSSAAPGVIAQIDEQPLSRCLAGEDDAEQIATEIDLGAGGTAEVQLDLVVHPSARGQISNTAEIQPGFGIDPVGSDNTATDTTTITVVSDLSIVKTAPAQAVAGEFINYQIEVTNAGPSDALGALIADAFVPALLAPTWTCTSSGDSACPSSGSGSINFATNLLVGDVLTINVSARINPAFVGPLANTASVTGEVGASDPTPSDHVSSVQTNVTAVADLSISKTDGVTTVTAGTPVSYQIQVANAGPSNAPSVRIRDDLSPVLLVATWTCSGSAGATCPASGNGSPDFVANMPTGSSVQLLINATLSPAANGSLTNTATVQVQGGVTDPVSTNNSSADTNSVLIVPDLVLTIEDLQDPYDPAGTIALPYVVRLHNAGPSDAHGVMLDLSVSNSASVTWPPGCVVVTTLLRHCDLGTVAAGATVELNVLLSGMASTLTSFALAGQSSTIDPDPNLANNATTQTTQLLAGSNVRVSITDDRTTVPTGYQTTYRIVVDNAGSVTATGVAISAAIPVELIDVTWSCVPGAGVTCGGPGIGALNDTITLARGQQVVYTLRATVDPDLDVSTPRTVTQQVSATLSQGVDIHVADNQAEDIDNVTPVLFADGFELDLTLLMPTSASPTTNTGKSQ